MSVVPDVPQNDREGRQTARIFRLPTSTETGATAPTYQRELEPTGEALSSLEDLGQDIKSLRELLEKRIAQERAEGARQTVSAGTYSWGATNLNAPLGRYYLAVTAFKAQGPSGPLVPVMSSPAEPNVPLSVALKLGSILWGVASVGSLVMWFLHDVAVLSPFVSVLGVVGAPFLYMMGIAASRR